jgi:hypothetical protein
MDRTAIQEVQELRQFIGIDLLRLALLKSDWSNGSLVMISEESW